MRGRAGRARSLRQRSLQPGVYFEHCEGLPEDGPEPGPTGFPIGRADRTSVELNVFPTIPRSSRYFPEGRQGRRERLIAGLSSWRLPDLDLWGGWGIPVSRGGSGKRRESGKPWKRRWDGSGIDGLRLGGRVWAARNARRARSTGAPGICALAGWEGQGGPKEP
jgi:hypothetical protein